jgi:hypothetical protein
LPLSLSLSLSLSLHKDNTKCFDDAAFKKKKKVKELWEVGALQPDTL